MQTYTLQLNDWELEVLVSEVERRLIAAESSLDFADDTKHDATRAVVDKLTALLGKLENTDECVF